MVLANRSETVAGSAVGLEDFAPRLGIEDLLRLIHSLFEHLLPAEHAARRARRDRSGRAAAAATTASGLSRLDVRELLWCERREVRSLLIEQLLFLITRIERRDGVEILADEIDELRAAAPLRRASEEICELGLFFRCPALIDHA